MALKGFIWATLSLLGGLIAVFIVLCMLMLASLLQRHNSMKTAEGVNDILMVAGIYYFAGDEMDHHE